MEEQIGLEVSCVLFDTFYWELTGFSLLETASGAGVQGFRLSHCSVTMHTPACLPS